MTPQELIDVAREAARDRLAEIDAESLKQAAASNLATARDTAEARLTDAGHFIESKVDEASDALEDDETRSIALGIAAGVTGVAVLIWALRRRRRARQEADLEESLYESSQDDVPDATDPRADEITVVS